MIKCHYRLDKNVYDRSVSTRVCKDARSGVVESVCVWVCVGVCVSRSAKEAEDKIKKALDKGEVLPTEARFDSNCITPGRNLNLYAKCTSHNDINKSSCSRACTGRSSVPGREISLF